jgi:hypothetical protein
MHCGYFPRVGNLGVTFSLCKIVVSEKMEMLKGKFGDLGIAFSEDLRRPLFEKGLGIWRIALRTWAFSWGREFGGHFFSSQNCG